MNKHEAAPNPEMDLQLGQLESLAAKQAPPLDVTAAKTPTAITGQRDTAATFAAKRSAPPSWDAQR